MPRPLKSGETGARSELLVCANLIKRGYEVFRAVSPHCSCDLLVLKSGITERIEVRTGYKLPSGKVMYPNRAFDRSRSDVTAVITQEDDVIWYFDTKTRSLLAMN